MSSQPGPEAVGASAAESVDADWVAICRRIVAAQRELFAEVRGSAARTEYEGIGEGGDWALVLDRRCEDVVFAELEALAAQGASFRTVSEERGEVAFGRPGATTHVVVDPIDGSLNVRRTLPSHSLSLAVASGDSMSDVQFGYVYDFGAGEEFIARRGGGATLDGEPLSGPPPASDRPLEILGLEAAKPALMGPLVEALADEVYRLRVVGSLAITLCYVAAARFDGMLSLRPARSVDVAAAQLIAREAGAAVAFESQELDSAGLGLEERYQVAGAWTPEGLETLLAGQRQVSE
ncbi:MAG: inositol monophosphatase family protein [Solirubrobacterales bacterium]